MNKLIAIAAFALAAITTPALAGSLTAEYRSASNPTTAGADFSASVYDLGPVSLGAEVQTVQPKHRGSVTDLFAVNTGTKLPSVAGFATTGAVEFGKSESVGNNFNFYGLKVGASRPLSGRVSAQVGYRYREGYNGHKLEENRLNAGLSYAVTKATSVGVNYYRYDEKYVPVHVRHDYNVLGIGVTQRF